jgi:signal transduction histidine kinase
MSLLMNGDLSLYSEGKGRGTTFTLTVPTMAKQQD